MALGQPFRRDSHHSRLGTQFEQWFIDLCEEAGLDIERSRSQTPQEDAIGGDTFGRLTKLTFELKTTDDNRFMSTVSIARNSMEVYDGYYVMAHSSDGTNIAVYHSDVVKLHSWYVGSRDCYVFNHKRTPGAVARNWGEFVKWYKEILENASVSY